VEKDGNIITANGPEAAQAFGTAIAAALGTAGK
jgi:putative intracellular protease/amidase